MGPPGEWCREDLVACCVESVSASRDAPMSLDPDAEDVLLAMRTLMPRPYHEVGIDEARRLSGSRQRRPGPPVNDVSDRVIPGPHGGIPIRVYRPGGERALPMLVWLHGGGWALGSVDNSDLTSRMIANEAGCVVVSVDYRLAPEHKFPVPFEDCLEAVRWVAGHGEEIGGDPTRLAVGGESAGANLAAAVALVDRERGELPISLQVLVYPATEYAVERPSWRRNSAGPVMTSRDVVWFWDLYLRDEADRSDPRATPSSATAFDRLPPAFVLTAEHDPLCDDGEAYARRLSAAGVDVRKKRYDGVFHGFFGMPGVLAKATEAVNDVVVALREVFDPAPVNASTPVGD
ncbi:alpha/beta hydrolase [Pseudonocardia kujensis]|uniref:alpha/beta hydrolase n=1 Tax=Pseudonocardia kujensis TaxID=1128675 RepID=UPI001E40BC31|nr:alpha/beta hydrolase [Pseudonocardia kujensis]MCE0767744.1 alpha/beta hydrolase [Pseudonocardia kujensis]